MRVVWRDLTLDAYAVAPCGRGLPPLTFASLFTERAIGYGHSHLEESIFGGFTQDMLNERRFSLFLFH